MGRGRAKAKQIKVARRLKYNSGPTTDLTALERELHAARRDSNDDYETSYAEETDEDDDPYAAYADDDDEDDYESWVAGGER